MTRTALVLGRVAVLAALAGCAGMSTDTSMAKVDNAALPEAVRVPAGSRMMMATTGVGEITYECREKAGAAGQYEWAFVGPVATLYGDGRRNVGKYYAGPTWEAADGSKITGKQVATAPAAPGSIPLQLVKAEPAMGSGAMSGVAYVQRVNTKGGVAPATACDMAGKGRRQQVAYEADYVFYGS